ncbi:MAG: permease-like cell division protein FtsX [Bacteroidales bacterium]|nr:permease-like cell division protein FtsX [Bacteroidales bacterium]
MSEKKLKRRSKIKLWAGNTSTVFSIMLVLFVFGLLMFVEYHSYMATHAMQEHIAYQLDLTTDATEEDALALRDELLQLDYVKEVDYISADEAARLFAQELDEDFLTLLDSVNPLYPTLMVTLKVNPNPQYNDKMRQTFKEEVDDYALVESITYHEAMINDLSQIFYKLSWLLVIFMILLLLVSVALISTTIKLSIYSNRYTIKTMNMVGAKMGFITRPFLRRSVLYGFLGALLATVFMYASIYMFNKQFHLAVFHPRYWIGYAVIIGVIFVVGIVISYLATYFSVHSHLRSTNNNEFN